MCNGLLSKIDSVQTIQIVLGKDLLRATDPITSTIRAVPSEVVVGPEDGVKQPCAVNLHHVMTVAKDDVGRRVAQLGDERMREVCRALAFSLGCGG